MEREQIRRSIKLGGGWAPAFGHLDFWDRSGNQYEFDWLMAAFGNLS